MQSAGKRAWRKQLEPDSTMNQDVQAGPSQARPRGKDKGKHRARVQNPDVQTTPRTVVFEGLNGWDYRKWWDEHPDTHLVKASIRKA